jgi:drug/metabolite transporter (DMT)-like permease
VLLAAVLHAVWNALTHAVTDKLVGAALLSLAYVWWGLVALPFVGVPAVESWPMLLVSVVLHFFYFVTMMRSYRLGAFNQVYPLARGMSPWVVAIVAVTFVGERLSTVQLVGVFVVSLGLGCLVLARGRPHTEELPAILAAVLTGLWIAAYTVVDGIGVRQSGDPFAYAAWLFLLHGLSLGGYAVAARGRPLFGELRRRWRLGAAAGVCSVLAYAFVLWAQNSGSLATVAALRETSVIVGAIIGAIAFREPFGRWRTVATVVVATGIVLLNWR